MNYRKYYKIMIACTSLLFIAALINILVLNSKQQSNYWVLLIMFIIGGYSAILLVKMADEN